LRRLATLVVVAAVCACERAEAPLVPPPKIIGSDGRIVQECKTPDHAPLYVGKKIVDFCAFADERSRPRGIYTFTSPEEDEAVWAYYRRVAEREGLSIEDEAAKTGERIFSARGDGGRTMRLTLRREKGRVWGKVEWRGA
jgi:hypothetical protein